MAVLHKDYYFTFFETMGLHGNTVYCSESSTPETGVLVGKLSQLTRSAKLSGLTPGICHALWYQLCTPDSEPIIADRGQTKP